MQRKKILKRTAGIVLAAALSCGVFSACSGGGKNGSDTVMLDLGSLMPTSNTTATVENPEVIQASKYIMEAYEQETGIKTEFATSYGRSISATIEQTSEWYQHQIEREIALLSDIHPSIISRIAIIISFWMNIWNSRIRM